MKLGRGHGTSVTSSSNISHMAIVLSNLLMIWFWSSFVFNLDVTNAKLITSTIEYIPRKRNLQWEC